MEANMAILRIAYLLAKSEQDRDFSISDRKNWRKIASRFARLGQFFYGT